MDNKDECNNSSNYKNKKRDFVEKLLKLLIQFIFSFVILIILVLELIKTFNGDVSVLKFLLELFMAIASNCCSISCTIMFLDKKKNDEYYINKKIFYIIFSLVTYLVLYHMESYTDGEILFQNKITLIVALSISAFLLFWIVFFIIKDFFVIQNDNDKFLGSYEMTEEQKIQIEEVHSTTNSEQVGEEVFNFGGDSDENQSNRS